VRKLQWSVAVLVLLLIVGDRVGVMVAGNVIATRLQATGSLTSKPSVAIRGYPFVTQALSGRYGRIDVTADDVERRSVRFERLDLTLSGARIELRDALSGEVSGVPVEGLTASALISFADIAKRSKLRGVTVERAGRELLLTGFLTVLGERITVRALLLVRLEGARLTLSPHSVDVEPDPTPETLTVVAPLLQLRIDVGTLPYGLRLTGRELTDEGIMLNAKTGPTILQRR